MNLLQSFFVLEKFDFPPQIIDFTNQIHILAHNSIVILLVNSQFFGEFLFQTLIGGFQMGPLFDEFFLNIDILKFLLRNYTLHILVK